MSFATIPGMTAVKQPRTKAALAGSRAAHDLLRAIGAELRRMREDAGLSARFVARAAGISHSTLLQLEAGAVDPTVEVVTRVAAVLGCRASLRLLPGAGPVVRDHVQIAMLRGVIPEIDPRCPRAHEVPVFRPISGYVDLVLDRPDPVTLAIEAQSELRKVEQTVRWVHAKAEALRAQREEQGRSGPVSTVLLLRSTADNRRAVALAAPVLGDVFPARMQEAVEALRDADRPWPGDALIWMAVTGEQARVLSRPPDGITVGR